MSRRIGGLAYGLAGAPALGAVAPALAEAPHTETFWLLVVRRIDGVTSTQALTSQDQCEEARLAEMLSARPKWKPEISMISDCVPVRLHDIPLKTSAGSS